MATGNKFQVLAGLDDDDNEFVDESEFGDFDEADIGAFGVLANNLQDLDIPAGALPPAAILPVVQIAPVLAAAAVLPGVQIAPVLAPAAVLPGVQIAPVLPPAAVVPGVQIAPALPPAALAPDQHPIHEDDDEKNPWIHVGPRRNLRNPDAPRQEYCLDPEEGDVAEQAGATSSARLVSLPLVSVSGADLDPCASPTGALERNQAMASANKFALLAALGDKGISDYLYQGFDHVLGGDDVEDDLVADHVEPAVPEAEELVPQEELNGDIDPVGNEQEDDDDPSNPATDDSPQDNTQGMDILNDALAIDAAFAAMFPDDDDDALDYGPEDLATFFPDYQALGFEVSSDDDDLPMLPHHPAPAIEDVDELLAYEEDGEAPNPNPWKLVQSRRFGRVRSTVPEVYPPTPPVRLCEIEVEWVPKTGTVRAMRKHSQARKSNYVSTPDGPGYFVYPSYVPEGYH